MFSLVVQLQVSLLQQKLQSTDIKITVYKALQKLANNYLEWIPELADQFVLQHLMWDLGQLKTELVVESNTTLSHILFTEAQATITMIVDMDYYSRVHQVVDRTLS